MLIEVFKKFLLHVVWKYIVEFKARYILHSIPCHFSSIGERVVRVKIYRKVQDKWWEFILWVFASLIIEEGQNWFTFKQADFMFYFSE